MEKKGEKEGEKSMFVTLWKGLHVYTYDLQCMVHKRIE